MRAGLLVPLVAVALAAGCGERTAGGPVEEGARTPAAVPAQTAPTEFPLPRGQRLGELAGRVPDGPRLVLGVSVFERGRNRVGFTLLDSARRQVNASAVALYTSRVDGTGLRGPYPATRARLTSHAAFRSAGSRSDLAGGDAFYVAEVRFAERGPRLITALARLDGRLVGTSRIEVRVGEPGGPPDVGERAVAVHTETGEDVGGDLRQLSTRRPPLPAMHEHDLADVLGRRPVVLLFATPQLCRTRVCGPVLDIAEQVRRRAGQGVVFIHQEIYVDNDADRGQRPQVSAWRLPSEPWAFVMDRSGKIVARFEGPFSAAELTAAVERARRNQGR
jgi:hypothetical protein